MMFVLTEQGPSIFCLLTEADIIEMRKGNTKFVDDHQFGDKSFRRVVFSLHRDNAEITDMLSMLKGIREAEFPAPRPGEAQCGSCHAITHAGGIFEEKCIVCWASQAKGGIKEGITIKRV